MHGVHIGLPANRALAPHDCTLNGRLGILYTSNCIYLNLNQDITLIYTFKHRRFLQTHVIYKFSNLFVTFSCFDPELEGEATVASTNIFQALCRRDAFRLQLQPAVPFAKIDCVVIVVQQIPNANSLIDWYFTFRCVELSIVSLYLHKIQPFSKTKKTCKNQETQKRKRIWEHKKF